MSIIAYPLEATEYTAEDVQTYLSTRTSGVFSEDIKFTPEGMAVTVSPFLAWFNYAKFKGCSVAVTEPETLNFSPAHAVLDRIDRVVLRLDFTLNKAYFTILEGEPSSSPTPKAITKTEIINDISPIYVRIRAGATEIAVSDITSTILDENVCGIMRDGVTGIPTAQIQAQAMELIEKLYEEIHEVESNSAFMMNSVYDPEGGARQVAFKEGLFPIGCVLIRDTELSPADVFGGVWERQKFERTLSITKRFDFIDANSVTTETIEVATDYDALLSNASIVATPRAGASRTDRMSVSVSGTTIDPELNTLESVSISVKSSDGVSATIYIMISGETYVDENGNAHWVRVE